LDNYTYERKEHEMGETWNAKEGHEKSVQNVNKKQNEREDVKN
jgi:hypothetical protein